MTTKVQIALRKKGKGRGKENREVGWRWKIAEREELTLGQEGRVRRGGKHGEIGTQGTKDA